MSLSPLSFTDQLFVFFPIFLSLILSVLYGIPTYLLAKSKGYTGLMWILLSYIPVVNFFSIFFIVGLPDKIFRNSLLVLLELKKKKAAKLNSTKE